MAGDTQASLAGCPKVEVTPSSTCDAVVPIYTVGGPQIDITSNENSMAIP